MSKPRATGADAVLLIAKETTPGTAVSGTAGGVYLRHPMVSSDYGGSQPLEADQIWNRPNPDDSDPSLGAFDVSGNLVVPVCSRGAGYFLTMALGVEPADPTDADGVYTHTWASGQPLDSWSVQTGHPQLAMPKWRTALGGKAGGLQFTMARNGRAQFTIPLTGMGEVKDATGARDASPLTYAYRPFDNATGAIKLGGSALANVTGAQFNYSNSLDAAETIRADMQIDGTDETIRTLSGTADLRLGTDHAIDDLVDGGTPGALEFSFALKAAPTWKLTFTLPRVFFELTKKSISGPGGISVTTNWRAAYDATAGHMLGVTLVNDVESY